MYPHFNKSKLRGGIQMISDNEREKAKRLLKKLIATKKDRERISFYSATGYFDPTPAQADRLDLFEESILTE